MSENNVPVFEPGVMKPKKDRRHLLPVVCLVALAAVELGSALGLIPGAICGALFPNAGDGVKFLFEFYLSFIGIWVLMLLYCGFLEKPTFRSFFAAYRGGSRGNTWLMLGFGALAGFVMNALCVLVAWLHQDLHFYVGAFDVPYLLLALFIISIQSGAEELVTRGYMIGALGRRYPLWVGVLANALLFAALHLLNPGVTVLSVVDLILYGAAMSMAAVYLDSLWFCFAYHTLWNWTQNIFFGLPNSGLVSASSFLHLEASSSSVFYDPVFGVEGALPAVIGELLLIGAILLYAWKKGRLGWITKPYTETERT